MIKMHRKPDSGFEYEVQVCSKFEAYSFKMLHSNLELISRISLNDQYMYLVKTWSKMMKMLKKMEWLKFEQSTSGKFLGGEGHQKSTPSNKFLS
jgi:hypothetical protein